MIDAEIRRFALASLREMNFDVEGLDDDSLLGPAGADLDSVALAELGIRVEDRFGVTFADDEAEQLAAMTIGEFCQAVAGLLAAAPTAGS
ncbi:acyl carrier protein [Actinospica durhamensis]|uniref:Acyl carrier protein n=1 Tax=Actinospica durhamensis TaxID=1508375 RepID=A0A941ESA5_9ACTN|nr:acyl carrier protein [Actinospica durhamensis]MBR7835552.1 acyl carrier protein [Actinospica durhamensis]